VSQPDATSDATSVARVFRARFAPLFGRKIARQRAEQYLCGLLGGRAERRDVTSLAQRSEGASARSLGWLLNKSPWATEPVIEALQALVAESLGASAPGAAQPGAQLPDEWAHPDGDGVFTLGIVGFPKRGDQAVGAARQYVGNLGRATTCQVGVFLAYATESGDALVDAALSLPREWIEDPDRRRAAGVPDDVELRSHTEHGVGLLRRARRVGRLNGTWVTALPGEGFEDDLRTLLAEDGWRYVLPVRPETLVREGEDGPTTSVRELAVAAASSGAADDGPLVRAAWEGADDGFMRRCWLVTRRAAAGGMVCYLSNAPENTPATTLQRLVTRDTPNDMSFASHLRAAGMDVYRVRGWDGWHRHATLTLLAGALRLSSDGGVPAPDDALATSARQMTEAVAPPAEPAPATVAPTIQPAPATVAPAIQPVTASVAHTVAEVTTSVVEAAASVAELTVSVAHTAKDLAATAVHSIEDAAATALNAVNTVEEVTATALHTAQDVATAAMHTVEPVGAAVAQAVGWMAASMAPMVEWVSGPVADPSDEVSRATPGPTSLADSDDKTTDRAAIDEPAGDAAPIEPSPTAAPDVATTVLDVATTAPDGASTLAVEPSPAVVEPASADGPSAFIGPDLSDAPNVSATVDAPGDATFAVVPVPAGNQTTSFGPEQAGSPNPSGDPADAADVGASAAVEAEPTTDEAQVVVVHVAEEVYGIDVLRVQEILRVPAITAIPNGPAFLDGLTNLRGQVIPVMDLRRHLGLHMADHTRRSRVVVAELGTHLVGLIVDAVSQVVTVSETSVQPPPPLVTGNTATFVRGIALIDDALVMLIDADSVLAA